MGRTIQTRWGIDNYASSSLSKFEQDFTINGVLHRVKGTKQCKRTHLMILKSMQKEGNNGTFHTLGSVPIVEGEPFGSYLIATAIAKEMESGTIPVTRASFYARKLELIELADSVRSGPDADSEGKS